MTPPQNRSLSGRFEPGHSGNPGGRPATRGLREWLSEIVRGRKQSRRHLVMEAVFQTATDRKHRDHLKAAELLMAHDFGRPSQAVKVATVGAECPNCHRLDGFTTEQLEYFATTGKLPEGMTADDLYGVTRG